MDKTKRKQQTFLQGAFILSASAALVKIIGAIFKIPLGNLLGGTGMGYFSSAYDLYLPIYTLAMAGLPIAISRLVAERVAEKRFKDVNSTLRIAQRIFLITGLAGSAILALAIYPYILYIGNSGAALSMVAIVPALLFCCIMSSYRGFYEGLRNMYPTAISSVIEALGKLFLGLGFAYLVILKAQSEFASLGTVFGKAVDAASVANVDEAIINLAAPYASAAAILGITVGSVLAAIYLIIYHKVVGSKITRAEIEASPIPYDKKKTLKMIVTISVPVVLGSLVVNFSSLIDLFTVQKVLANSVEKNPAMFMDMYAGLLPDGTSDLATLHETVPNYLYGCYKGFAYSVFNLVPSLTAMLGVSAIPVLATAWIEKKSSAIKSNIESMVRITSLIAMPAGIGICVLSGPIMELLYSGKVKETAITAPMLTVLGIAAVFTGLTTPITNMLQAIGKQNIPVRNITIGAVLKFVVNIVLVGIPVINIMGAPIGTLACYFFHFSANFYALVKYSKVKLNYFAMLIKPLFCSILCGVTALCTHGLLSHIITNKNFVTVLAIGAAGAVYLVAVILTKCFSKEDLKSFKGSAN